MARPRIQHSVDLSGNVYWVFENGKHNIHFIMKIQQNKKAIHLTKPSHVGECRRRLCEFGFTLPTVFTRLGLDDQRLLQKLSRAISEPVVPTLRTMKAWLVFRGFRLIPSPETTGVPHGMSWRSSHISARGSSSGVNKSSRLT